MIKTLLSVITIILLLVSSCLLLPFYILTQGEKSCLEDSLDVGKKQQVTILPSENCSVYEYRFVLSGDFNGDGLTDTLSEDSCFFKAAGLPLTDTLCCPFLLYSEVIGDIDQNGTDEIGLVSTNGDYSSVTRYRVYTYNSSVWKCLLEIETWEWVFPPLPYVTPQYYPMGFYKDTLIHNDSINQMLIENLKEFRFATIVKGGQLQYEGRPSVEIPFCDFASSIEMRYNVRSNEIHYRLPDFARNDTVLSTYGLKWSVIKTNTITIEGAVFYLN